MNKYNIYNAENVVSGKDINWPVVYILECDDGIYIGETNQYQERFKSHNRKWNINKKWIISHEEGNKSITYMIESFLIDFAYAELEQVRDKRLLNEKMQENQIWSGSDFHKREEYKNDIYEIWDNLKSKGVFKGEIDELKNSEAYRYSPFKRLNEEQLCLLQDLKENIIDGKNSFIHGAAGTGKTLLSMHLAIEMAKNNSEIKVGIISAKSGKSKVFKRRIKTLDKKVVGKVKIIESISKESLANIDHLIIDEGQLLRKWFFDAVRAPKHFDEGFSDDISFIESLGINYTLFFDHLQSVERYSIDTINTFTEDRGEHYKINTQHRIETKVDFMEFLNKLFMRSDDDVPFDFSDYDIKSFDNKEDLYSYVKVKEEEFGMSRLISSISTNKWESRNDNTKSDFKIGDDDVNWNKNLHDWVEREGVDSVGSIYSVHGSDLSYAGVFFGDEVKLDNREIIIDAKHYQRYKGGQVFKGLSEDEKKEKILNIYQVLLTRGSKGLGVYIPDLELRRRFEMLIGQN